jgi:hypothetical protein
MGTQGGSAVRTATATGSTPWLDTARPCLGRLWLAASEATEAEERHLGTATGAGGPRCGGSGTGSREAKSEDGASITLTTQRRPQHRLGSARNRPTRQSSGPAVRSTRAAERRRGSSAQRRGRDGGNDGAGQQQQCGSGGREAQGPAVGLGAARVKAWARAVPWHRGADERSERG